ncbi:MAG: hypothetical protein NZ870_03355, partial [bacterium]|nr:hypothetical protein [bacterium]
MNFLKDLISRILKLIVFFELLFIKKNAKGVRFSFLDSNFTKKIGFLDVELKDEKCLFLKIPETHHKFLKIPYPFVFYGFKKGKDIRTLWELNRLKFLAYYAKNNPEFAKNILKRWIINNPFPFGPNWFSSMEVATRAINLLIAANYIPIQDKLLLKHKVFIEKNLERGRFYTSNHYIANLMGLLALSIYFKDKKSIEFCIKEIEKEVDI